MRREMPSVPEWVPVVRRQRCRLRRLRRQPRAPRRGVFAKDTTGSASFNGAVGSESCLHTATTRNGACQVSGVDGCSRSLDATACLVCDDGMVLDAGRCVEDRETCLSMHTGTCVACDDGNYVDPSVNACLSCPAHCTACTFDGTAARSVVWLHAQQPSQRDESSRRGVCEQCQAGLCRMCRVNVS